MEAHKAISDKLLVEFIYFFDVTKDQTFAGLRRCDNQIAHHIKLSIFNSTIQLISIIFDCILIYDFPIKGGIKNCT